MDGNFSRAFGAISPMPHVPVLVFLAFAVCNDTELAKTLSSPGLTATSRCLANHGHGWSPKEEGSAIMSYGWTSPTPPTRGACGSPGGCAAAPTHQLGAPTAPPASLPPPNSPTRGACGAPGGLSTAPTHQLRAPNSPTHQLTKSPNLRNLKKKTIGVSATDGCRMVSRGTARPLES